MMVIVMQSVMVEKVFYGVPHHLGWFEHKHGGMLESHKHRVEDAKHAADEAGDKEKQEGVEMTDKPANPVE